MVRLHRQETVITEKTNTTCDNVLNGPSSRMHGKICEAPHKPSYPNWFIYKGGEGGGGGGGGGGGWGNIGVQFRPKQHTLFSLC